MLCPMSPACRLRRSSPSCRTRCWRRRAAGRSLREKGKRPPGKQPGEPGTTMRLVDDPDERLFFPPAECRGCGEGLAGEPVAAQRRHQVTDVQPAPARDGTEAGGIPSSPGHPVAVGHLFQRPVRSGRLRRESGDVGQPSTPQGSRRRASVLEPVRTDRRGSTRLSR